MCVTFAGIVFSFLRASQPSEEFTKVHGKRKGLFRACRRIEPADPENG
jgi:hypothetical protein